MERHATVLILFADALAAPEVTWSLLDAGMDVIAVARQGSSPALVHSRRARVVEIADPAVSADRCLADLAVLLRRTPEAVVMPLDDLAIWIVHHLRQTVDVRVCGATGRNADLTLDKRLQLVAAAAAGFHVPGTLEIDSAGALAQIDAFPCIVKPALAARISGDAVGRGRAFVLSDAAHRDACGFVPDPVDPMLSQPHIAGVGEGVFGLATDSGIVAWSGHRRVRMMNPAGSGSSACVNIEPEEETVAAAQRFLESLGWRGLFMIELLRDQQGKLWFMEINGRPWGSMALAIRAGLDYPAWAVRATLNAGFAPVLPDPPSRPLLCRHVGRELMHLAFVARGPGPDNPSGEWPTLAGTLQRMLTPYRPQAIYNWRRNDPMVFFADVLGSLRPLWRSGKPRGQSSTSIVGKVRRRLATLAERRRQRRLRARGLPLSSIREARSVLFLCYGNINRSALAERHLRQLTGDEFAVASCGLHRHARRAADPQMVAVARENGIDLDNWSSRTLSAKLVHSSDIIFAMEASHLSQLLADYPAARGRTFLLGSMSPDADSPLEIEDPFGKPRADYERCLREVVAATSSLARHLASAA
jgi:protein-tyrosine-phosphatase/formate-dependent phosphoribosylglycinamide formyltransferase (GAR transformylase)